MAGDEHEVVTGTSGARLAGIASVTDPVRRKAEVDLFLLALEPAITRMARSLCRRYNAPAADYFEDVRQVIFTEAWVMVTEAMLDPAPLQGVGNWEGLLWARAKWKVRDSIHHTASRVSGVASAWKRHHEMTRTLVSLRLSLGREPSAQEVTDATNERLMRTRKDARDQGILCRPSDLTLPGAGASLDQVEETPGSSVDDDFVLHPAEGRATVRAIIAECARQDASLGRFASLWMADVYTSGGAEPGTDTITYIARTMGLRRGEVLRLQSRVRQVGVEILRRAGVEPPESSEAG